MRIPYRWAVALTAALGLFMAVLDTTIVNVALSAMQQSFHTDVNTIQWVITGYFLAQAAVIPVAGYCSNRFGAKRTFIFSLAIFTLGSLLCGLTPDLLGVNGGDQAIIACRIFQGIGGGMLFPLATAIAFGAFPPAERAVASSMIAIPVLLAPTLGPTIGGLIVDSPLAWPGIFYINIPIGIIAILLTIRVLRPDQPKAAAEGSRFDWMGLLLSMLGSSLIVYAFSLVSQTRPGTATAQNPQGDIWGWSYWLVWALVAAGLVALALFALYETKKSEDPVLDLRLFRAFAFTVSTVLTWLVRAAIFGSFFILPIFLQQFRGESAVTAGLALMPQGAAAAIAVATGGKLYDWIGPRALVLLGMAALVISSFMLVGINQNTDALSLVPTLLIRGLGFGWSNIPLQTIALSDVMGKMLPKASSLYNATAQIFSSVGVAVCSTIFVQQSTSYARSAVTAAHGAIPSNLPVLAAAAGASDTFKVVTIASVLLLILSLLLPRQSIKQQQGPGGQDAEVRDLHRVPEMA